MKVNSKLFTVLLLAAIFTSSAQAQVFEGTNQWGNFDHSAWKIEPQAMQNYVIMGNKFFEPANNTLYMSEFNEFAQFNSWNRVHTTTETLNTFWKNFCKSTFPVGYFAAVGASGNKVYAILTNATGQKLWDRVSTVPFGMQYGGACQATNGGYLACGGTNSGSLGVTKFDAYGVPQWTNEYPVSGFGWTIKPANGGGYVMAGTRSIARIDVAGNLVWSTTLNLPTSPDGSAYSYTEFEEITVLPDGQGFVLTGSCFSNSHSGVYTARVSWSGGVTWSKINDAVSTALAGTPVCWVNNAVMANGNTKVITSWRRGPVSAGGGLFAQTVNIADGAQGAIKSLNNTTPVQEAFATRAHGRLVIGGTRGTYSQAYAYANTDFLNLNTAPQSDVQLDETNILNVPTGNGFLTSVQNAHPTYEKGKIVFDDPIMAFASRTTHQDLHVFPNPSTGVVYVGGVMEVGATLRVFDLAGRMVMEKTVPEGDAMVTFDLTSQPKGMYTVQMVGDRYNVTRKFIIE